MEWCPPGHGDLYPSLMSTGLLDQLIDAGYRYAFVVQLRQPRRRGRCPGRRLVRPVGCAVRDRGRAPYQGRPQGWPLRPPQGRRPDHPARDRADRRRPTWTRSATSTGTSTPPPTTCGSTSSACAPSSDRRDGILGLPLIRNQKNVDPADAKSPEVIQIETAMGAAIEVFEDSRTIEVGRDRFVPVKTTNDLLVLRSDAYDLGRRLRARPGGRAAPVRRPRRRALQAGRGLRQALPGRGAVPEGGRVARRLRRLDLRLGRPGARALPGSRANAARSTPARFSGRTTASE